MNVYNTNSTDFPNFVAIDFETADDRLESACSVGLVRVEKGQITGKTSRLIKPPRNSFRYTHIHGISWENVRAEPTFGEVWLDLEYLLENTEMLVAHYASFDKAVLLACANAAGIQPPCLPFECTVKIARKVWDIRSASLPNVCKYLKLPLDHHDALSDAEACAMIMIMALREHRHRGKK